MRLTPKRKAVFLQFLALLPAFLAVFVYLLVKDRPFPFPDCEDYMNLAQTLVDERHYACSGNLSSLSSSRRTPGYPLCLAIGNIVAGRHGYFLVNVLFLYGIVAITLRLAEKWGIKSRYVAILFCLSPGLIACTSVPLTEICFTLCLIACLYCILGGQSVKAGLWLASATIVRPIGMFLFIPLALWYLWKKRSFKPVLLFILLANSLPALWIARNYWATGHIFYTTLGGYNILYYKAGNYLSYRDGEDFEAVRQRLSDSVPHTGDPVLDERAAHKLGRELIRQNLVGFCLWAPRNMLNFWMPDIAPLLERLEISQGNRGTYDVLNRCGIWAAVKHYLKGNFAASALTAVYLLYYVFLAILMFAGAVRLYRQHHFDPVFLAILLTAYLAILPLGNLDWRFRIPAVPLHFLLAAAAMPFSNGSCIRPVELNPCLI